MRRHAPAVDSELDRSLQELRQAVMQPVADRDRWRDDVRAALRRFEAALQAHQQATESRTGSFNQALEQSLGRVRAEVGRLTRDHVRIWSQLRFLDERVDADVLDLREEVAVLADELTDHHANVQRLNARSRVRLE